MPHAQVGCGAIKGLDRSIFQPDRDNTDAGKIVQPGLQSRLQSVYFALHNDRSHDGKQRLHHASH
jgi:hypothetical protein